MVLLTKEKLTKQVNISFNARLIFINQELFL
ncbi:MAG: hypothetical protein ACI87J_000806 [Colwellia sp.]|jgi:hypothetical protein